MNRLVAQQIQKEQNHGRRKYGRGELDFAHDDAHTQEEWLAMIDAHGIRARHETPMEYRQRLVKIAGLAVSAIEAFDRKREKTANSSSDQ